MTYNIRDLLSKRHKSLIPKLWPWIWEIIREPWWDTMWLFLQGRFSSIRARIMSQKTPLIISINEGFPVDDSAFVPLLVPQKLLLRTSFGIPSEEGSTRWLISTLGGQFNTIGRRFDRNIRHRLELSFVQGANQWLMDHSSWKRSLSRVS